jgi:hypothetical protein
VLPGLWYGGMTHTTKTFISDDAKGGEDGGDAAGQQRRSGKAFVYGSWTYTVAFRANSQMERSVLELWDRRKLSISRH